MMNECGELKREIKNNVIQQVKDKILCKKKVLNKNKNNKNNSFSVEANLQKYYGKYLKHNETIKNSEVYFEGDVVKDYHNGWYVARVIKQNYIRVPFENSEYRFYNRLLVQDVSNKKFVTIVTWQANTFFVLAIGKEIFLEGTVDREMLEECNVTKVIEAGMKGLRNAKNMLQVSEYLENCSLVDGSEMTTIEKTDLKMNDIYAVIAQMDVQGQRKFIVGDYVQNNFSNKDFYDCLVYLNKHNKK